MQTKATVLDQEAIHLVLERLASEVIERHANEGPFILIGIERRGVDLAKRLGEIISKKINTHIPQGTLDINLYRDDWTSIVDYPHIGTSHIPEDISNRTVILVDDVLYSGRTIRAALDALLAYGRPKKVELLVLIDRGHRELPIQADYVGKMVTTSKDEQVSVLLCERDGKDVVLLECK
ncbi:MAG: bifunctional pyr operon transcriptional regulator/uracil phosphoribosyltransferase PyrR [Desulfovibrionaceae bacterium]|nr:bifunctional pyr operon transcriptional regulator/uracil phosphoribosyltransferase PyrR [Desulfovibrionaceae bacterium]